MNTQKQQQIEDQKTNMHLVITDKDQTPNTPAKNRLMAFLIKASINLFKKEDLDYESWRRIETRKTHHESTNSHGRGRYYV